MWIANEQIGIVAGNVRDAAHTTQKNPLGTRQRFADGREFVYCSTAADLVAGKLVQAAAPTAVTANKLTAAAIGATEVIVELAGVSANDYQGGFLHLTDDTGQGYSYEIKENTASDGSNKVTLTLAEGLVVAVDTTTDCVLTKCLYATLTLGDATSKIVGTPVVATTAATDGATQYFWVQTKGPGVAMVKTATSLAEGVSFMAGADAGIVIADGTLEPLGVVLSAAEDASGFQPVFWNVCI